MMKLSQMRQLFLWEKINVEFAVELWYNNSVYGFYSRTPGDSSVNKMRKDV